ncbi:MAG TPA: hypothetical protein VJO35_08805 [Terriglobales bacterium]|nr:hypothetical protein [Terriglobales bacterium]
MPLLKPPEPLATTRRVYLRIDESLALTAERYAEFLGTDKLDHVVSQALEFIFKRDSQFKQWVTQYSGTTVVRALPGKGERQKPGSKGDQS